MTKTSRQFRRTLIFPLPPQNAWPPNHLNEMFLSERFAPNRSTKFFDLCADVLPEGEVENLQIDVAERGPSPKGRRVGPRSAAA